MSDLREHNKKVFQRGIADFEKTLLKNRLIPILKDVANTFVGYIDEEFSQNSIQFPVYSGNLHDATGVGVYYDGRIEYFVPTKWAEKPQTMGDGTYFFGSETLRQAMQACSTQFASGIWIVLFSSVPYAYEINENGSPKARGKDFFNTLRDWILEDVINGFKSDRLLSVSLK